MSAVLDMKCARLHRGGRRTDRHDRQSGGQYCEPTAAITTYEQSHHRSSGLTGVMEQAFERAMRAQRVRIDDSTADGTGG
ncbi:protein of unknown function [Paraburkholderia dioscoreae]|uniref:Uncharacterized protein n=1 Tax=Paraburkholderia dioscoreae TaxID=2604047 RepID=A0A5Q4YT39_9BURK|nr:protein of unknown function [Paraburkholderia dioscoreae]